VQRARYSGSIVGSARNFRGGDRCGRVRS